MLFKEAFTVIKPPILEFIDSKRPCYLEKDKKKKGLLLKTSQYRQIIKIVQPHQHLIEKLK